MAKTYLDAPSIGICEYPDFRSIVEKMVAKSGSVADWSTVAPEDVGIKGNCHQRWHVKKTLFVCWMRLQATGDCPKGSPHGTAKAWIALAVP